MTLAFPKPPKPTRSRSHMGLVAQLACVCCGAHPVEVHHIIHGRFAQRRASDTETIPLCHPHHTQLHHEPRAWKALYGQDWQYLPQVQWQVEALKGR